MHTLSDISTYQQQAATVATTTPATAATLPVPSATAFSPPTAAASNACQHSSRDSSQTAQRATAKPEARDHSGSPDLAFVLQPRMQMGMTHIATAACYTAVANVARTLAKSAVAADQTNAMSAGTIMGWTQSCSHACHLCCFLRHASIQLSKGTNGMAVAQATSHALNLA